MGSKGVKRQRMCRSHVRALGLGWFPPTYPRLQHRHRNRDRDSDSDRDRDREETETEAEAEAEADTATVTETETEAEAEAEIAAETEAATDTETRSSRSATITRTRIDVSQIKHISHVKESWHISTSHVTHQWVMSRINESCQISTTESTHEQGGENPSDALYVQVIFLKRALWCGSCAERDLQLKAY